MRHLVHAALLLLAAALAGCAEKGPILIAGASYQPPAGLQAGAPKAVIAVSGLQDQRTAQPGVIGRRTISGSTENDLVVSGTAASLATGVLVEALKARGGAVQETAAGDPANTAAWPAGADILIGGEVKALWVDVLSQPFKVSYRATVQLRVSAAGRADGKVFRTLNVSSDLKREELAYSDYTVQDLLGQALSSAVEQVLKDDEISTRIR